MSFMEMREDLVKRLYEETIKAMNGDEEDERRLSILRQSAFVFCTCASGIDRDKKEGK